MSRIKPWGGRFQEGTDPAVERFTASIDFDRTLVRHDIRGSIAHARMLGRAGVVPQADADAIVAGLEAILADVDAGTLQLDPQLEDIHMNVETRLRERIGAVAGRLHTGRSRNDQVATDLALYLRETSRSIRHGLVEMREAFAGSLMWPIERAREISQAWREWVAGAPDELSATLKLVRFPPFPQVPDPLRGRARRVDHLEENLLRLHHLAGHHVGGADHAGHRRS